MGDEIHIGFRDRERPTLLSDRLERYLGSFDCVIIDGPPSVGKDVAVGLLVKENRLSVRGVGDFPQTDTYRSEGERGISAGINMLTFSEAREYYPDIRFR